MSDHDENTPRFDLKKLETLAEAATCRPWRYEEDEPFPGWFDIRNSTAFMATFVKENDAAFIVEACNSATYLIAEILTLRERVQSLEKQREWLASEIVAERTRTTFSKCLYQKDDWIEAAERAVMETEK